MNQYVDLCFRSFFPYSLSSFLLSFPRAPTNPSSITIKPIPASRISLGEPICLPRVTALNAQCTHFVHPQRRHKPGTPAGDWPALRHFRRGAALDGLERCSARAVPVFGGGGGCSGFSVVRFLVSHWQTPGVGDRLAGTDIPINSAALRQEAAALLKSPSVFRTLDR